ncbi:MAG: DUF2892 domain-containing protein [Bacteroidetes bacterium]|nr:DUF2892 domain-containing protein [Bacteroidota bacterium]
MKRRNVGLVDSIIRISAAVIIGILYFAHVITGVFAAILIACAIMFVFSGFVRFCPLYFFLGTSTCPVKKSDS